MMHFFGKVFLVKKFQRIQTDGGRHFRQKFYNSQSRKHKDEGYTVFNTTIRKYMHKYDNENEKKVTQIIEFIAEDEEYQQLYSQILGYGENETISQPKLTELLNQSSVFAYILQFLDFQSLISCSLVNSTLLFHSYSPNIIHHLCLNEYFLNKIDKLYTNRKNRLGARLGGIDSIELDLTNNNKVEDTTNKLLSFMEMVNDRKKLKKLNIKCNSLMWYKYKLDDFIKYLQINEIDKQLICFEIFNPDDDDNFDGESKCELLNLENCEKISLVQLDESQLMGIKISNKCKILKIGGEWKTKQFSQCDFNLLVCKHYPCTNLFAVNMILMKPNLNWTISNN